MDRPDLNLAQTFCALYERGNASRAADALGLTQSTVSHALSRMRRTYGDPLFTRTARGLSPTATADALYPGIRDGLDRILAALANATDPSPQTTRRTFRIWMSDLGQLMFLPGLATELRAQAPLASLEVGALDVSAIPHAFERGAIDAAVATPALVHPGVARRLLLRDEYVVIAAADHPRIRGHVEADQLAAEPRIRFPSGVGHELPEDRTLPTPRAGTLWTATFAAAVEVVRRSDYLAVVPWLLADRFGDGLQLLSLPMPVADAEVSAYHLESPRQSPAQRWFTDLLVDTCRRLARNPG